MLTKTSSNPKNEKATAYGCLLTNLLVLPGIGTIMAGKKNEGICQIVLSSIGIIFTLTGIFMLLVVLTKSLSNPFIVLSSWEFWMIVIGVLIFLVGWLWSAWSIYPLLQNSKKNEKSDQQT